ncbi:MAG: hypothetical protein U9O98_10230 [Asgard group archaeon]|nr:hypothetical protein [Asgard group archaeon]
MGKKKKKQSAKTNENLPDDSSPDPKPKRKGLFSWLRKDKKKQKSEKSMEKESEEQDLIKANVYNLLFDEMNLFLKELSKLTMEEVKKRLVLLDGKMLWLEKMSQLDEKLKQEGKDIIDLEMEKLEMGLELDSAEEIAARQAQPPQSFDLNELKNQLHEEEPSLKEVFSGLLEDVENDSIEKPINELMSKFILFDLRALIEQSINQVFYLEGKIKNLKKETEDQKKEIEKMKKKQKEAVQHSLKDMLKKLRKEKPKMLLSKERLNEFKALTQKQIAELKAKEEEELESMIENLLQKEKK